MILAMMVAFPAVSSAQQDQATLRRVHVMTGAGTLPRNPANRLEKDLDTTVVTWMNAMIWSSMRRGKVTGPIHGFGKLLASLGDAETTLPSAV